MSSAIKNKSNWDEKKKSVFVSILFGVLLLIIYGRNVMQICTVWELGDEFGYLNNAAYLVGFNWKEVASKIGYHGFGYSVILIPLFYICETGVELIRGGIIINYLLIYLIYALQISAFSKIYPDIKKTYICIASFLVSLNPYLMANANKITCEVMLTMWLLVMTRCLIWTLEKNKKICFTILSFVSSYVFFIHTRAIIALGVMCLLIIYMGIRKKIAIGSVVSYFIALFLSFTILYLLKMNIIDFALARNMRDGQPVVNIVTGQDIYSRIVNLLNLDNLQRYLCGFAARFFYLASSSGMVIVFGCIESVKYIKINLLNEERKEAYYLVFIFMTFVLTLMASVVYSGGVGNNLSYTMYGRYYEHTAVSIIFMGIIYFLWEKSNKYEVLFSFLFVLTCGLITRICAVYWENQQESFDTARLSGITYAIESNSDFMKLCMYLVLIQAISCAIYLLIKNQLLRVFAVMSISLLLIYKNDTKVMEIIRNVNERAEIDAELTQYYIENEESDVYIFVDSEYIYPAYYAREQVLLFDKSLKVVQEEELEAEQNSKYVISYINSPFGRKKEEQGELVFRGDCFGIYFR